MLAHRAVISMHSSRVTWISRQWKVIITCIKGRGNEMLSQRLKEVLAIMLVGDGLIAAIAPRRLSRLWQFGPRPYRNFMERFIQRPGMTRMLSMSQVAAGLWLALRQLPR